MKIAFDAKRAMRNHTGLGNYSRCLLEGLRQFHPEIELTLFSPKPATSVNQSFAEQFRLVLPTGVWKLAPALWRSYGVAKQVVADIYHGLSNEIPLVKNTPYKKVVTIHDLIFLKYHEQYSWPDRKIYQAKTRWACTHADVVIATSEETKRDILHFYKTDERKIIVVAQSCAPAFFVQRSNSEFTVAVSRYHLPQKFLLNVSSFFPRKNQAVLIQAYLQLADKIEEDLVLVGSAGNEQYKLRQLAQQSRFAQRIHFLQINNEDLPALYKQASAFVYPSLYEGFGIQLVEAMASDTLLLASDIASFREVAQDAAIYFSPTDANELAEKIWILLSNEKMKKELRARIAERANFFLPSLATQRMVEVYRRLLQDAP